MARSPRFTVIVPTRNRPETLRATLRTCVEQDFEDVELIVSDNASVTPARAIAEDVAGPKVRWLRTAGPLAMSDHWEFALREASGEYVMIIGDDDGLIPGALATLDRLLVDWHPLALRWDHVGYAWPSLPEPSANRLVIPMRRESLLLDSRNVIREVAANRLDFALLPSPYSGVVRREILEEIRRRTGRVFHGSTPDIFAGFAVAYLVKEYQTVSYPLSIGGTSGLSNGYLHMWKRGRDPVADDFNQLNRAAGHGWNPVVPRIPTIPSCLAEAFYRAKSLLFKHDASLDLERRALYRACLHAVAWWDPVDHEMAIEAIRVALEDDSELVAWFETESQKYAARPPAPPLFAPIGFDGQRLVLDAALLGVTDVHSAARTAAAILGPAPTPEQFTGPHRRLPLSRRLRVAVRTLVKGY